MSRDSDCDNDFNKHASYVNELLNSPLIKCDSTSELERKNIEIDEVKGGMEKLSSGDEEELIETMCSSMRSLTATDHNNLIAENNSMASFKCDTEFLSTSLNSIGKRDSES